MFLKGFNIVDDVLSFYRLGDDNYRFREAVFLSGVPGGLNGTPKKKPNFVGLYLDMGQSPVLPVNIPIPTKIGSKIGGEFTNPPKWDPKTVLTTTSISPWEWPFPPKFGLLAAEGDHGVRHQRQAAILALPGATRRTPPICC